MLNEQVWYDGRVKSEPEQQSLRAGPLSLVYEPGELRHIRLGEREILSRIYVALRDHNWNTIPNRLDNVRIEAAADRFRIAFEAVNHKEGIDFRWHGEISGEQDGTIAFVIRGKAHSTFSRNRLGFCVLHPMRECAGEPCVVHHLDGSLERGRFPLHIAPQQPFKDMCAISYDVTPQVRAVIRFEGDVFEMEDQRNWTDASFKTYCTPLDLPFPVTVSEGAEVSQSVNLRLELVPGTMWTVPHGGNRERPASLRIEQRASVPLPRVGLSVAQHGEPLAELDVSRLRALNLGHLRATADLGRKGFRSALERAIEQSHQLDLPLQLALWVPTRGADQALRLAGETLAELDANLMQVFVYDRDSYVTTSELAKQARDILAPLKVELGGGTEAYFAQLNRARPPLDLLDAVSYSLNPQVHAFDNRSLAETLPTQAVTVESARQFCGDTPLDIGPVTLRPRFNPAATKPPKPVVQGELPPYVDRRQMSLFGAGWTVGSLRSLGSAGVAGLTYYETTGWAGVLERVNGSPAPFPSIPGTVFPLYHVLADVGAFAGGEVLVSHASRPDLVEGLALRKGGRCLALVANLTAWPVEVALQGVGSVVRVRLMDATNVERAVRKPDRFRGEGDDVVSAAGELWIGLRPFAVARFDWQVMVDERQRKSG